MNKIVRWSSRARAASRISSRRAQNWEMIGCKSKTVAEWDAWFAGSEVFETDRDSEDFRRIRACFEAYKAYMLVMGIPAPVVVEGEPTGDPRAK
jgi:hypothetical protein